MSGSASSTAARKCFTKYLCRKFSYTLQEIFVILYTGMPYNLLIQFKNFKSILQVDIVFKLILKIITMGGTMLYVL